MMVKDAIVVWRIQEGSTMRFEPYGQGDYLTQLCILHRECTA